MATYLRIKGDLVEEVEEAVMSSVALRDFLPLIERRPAIYSPILPSNTRAVYWDSSNKDHQKLLFLIEREPQIIHMPHHARDAERAKIYKLSIPWSQFFFAAETNNPLKPGSYGLTQYKVFWTKERMTDPKMLTMIPAMVPNIYDDGRICFGNTAVDVNQHFSDRMDATVNNFYVNDFNNHLAIKYPNNWRGWNEWVKMTEENPMGWMDWPDWDGLHPHKMYSWETLTQAAIPARDELVISPETIPPLNRGATWGAANEWWLTLTNNQRARLADIARTTPDALLTPIATETI